MTNRSTTWCGCSRRGGLTLIEVVAAIAILGTVLVGIVIAKARHTHQLARAHRLDLAVGAADDLIAGWWLSEAGVPVAADGPIEGQPLMNWQTVVAPNAAIEQLGARVVRVSIRDAYDAETRRTPEAPVVFVVDLVLPAPEAGEPAGEAADSTAVELEGAS